MNSYFQCKISYDKTLENGMQKRVTEPYLVDACSYTEAEERITKEIRPYVTGDFAITDIKRARYSEIFFNPDGDRYYDCGVEFISLDEKNGSEKKTKAKMLVQASTLEEAMKGLSEGMKGTLSDYNSVSIYETKIMDIFTYNEDKPE